MMQPLPQRVKFQLAAAVIWYVPIAVMWFAVAGWFWSPVIPVQGEGAPHVVLHQSIAAQTWREWLASAALFVTGQVIAMLVKAWSASARRTVALSRFLDVPFFGGHAFAAVLCVRACSNVWSDRASAFSAAVAASDGGADLAQHDGGDGVWQNTTKRAGNLALVNLNLAADSADVNNVYSFVCLFVGLVAGAINALHYLRREESVLAFPTVPRERYLRIARRWKPSILGAVTQAAWLCVVCFLCISSLVAVIAVYCDVAAGAGLLPTIARELASLASITFRPTGCAGSAANASAAAGAQECAADVAAQSSVHGRSALSLIVFGLAPRLIALVLPIGVTIAAAFRMGAGFVEVFLTSPLPEVQHYNREGVSAADDDEDLPALIDALRIAVPHSAEADMKAFDAHSGASAAAASGFSGALRGSMRRSVARWEAEVTHHERRFQSAAQSQLVERSPDVTPPAAGSFRKRSRHLEWSLDVSRAQALLSLRDAALHRVGLRDAIYSDLATWLVIARACTAVIDAMTLQVRRACVCCGSTFFCGDRSVPSHSHLPPLLSISAQLHLAVKARDARPVPEMLRQPGASRGGGDVGLNFRPGAAGGTSAINSTTSVRVVTGSGVVQRFLERRCQPCFSFDPALRFLRLRLRPKRIRSLEEEPGTFFCLGDCRVQAHVNSALFKIQTLFADAQAVMWAADVVSTLAARATVEERHGAVHVAVPAVLISLVGAIVAVEKFQNLVRAASSPARGGGVTSEAAARALFGSVAMAEKHHNEKHLLSGHALEVHDALTRATCVFCCSWWWWWSLVSLQLPRHAVPHLHAHPCSLSLSLSLSLLSLSLPLSLSSLSLPPRTCSY